MSRGAGLCRAAGAVLAALALFVTIVAAPVTAQPPVADPAASAPSEIAIGTRLVRPFVFQRDNGQLDGFSVALWQAITVELGLKTRFVVFKTLPALLEASARGEVAASIAAISITAQRETAVDFSQPMFLSGLSIMVPVTSGRLDVASVLFSRQTLSALAIVLVVLFVPAHIVWIAARGRDEGLPIARAYFPGIFDALFWCAESMGGAPQGYPRRLLPRLVALVWLYTSIIMISYFTAFATTSLTVQTLKGDIESPSDLVGRTVGVVGGTTSAAYMGSLKARTADFADFDSAADALVRGEVEAVVYDTPVILHFVANGGRERARIAGAQFRGENYGIAFPHGSALRRSVNRALLTLIENGDYGDLTKKWFGQ